MVKTRACKKQEIEQLLKDKDRKGLHTIKQTVKKYEQALNETKVMLQDTLEAKFKIRIVPTSDPLSVEDLSDYSRQYNETPLHRATANALAAVPISVLAENRRELQKINYAYSHTLSLAPKASSQGQSGRCWMFAALNSMRYHLIKNLNLCDRFELSEAYLFYYDKIERSYCFLNKAVENRHLPLTDPVVTMITSKPLSDGGTWSTLCGLITKYGILPKSCYGEGYNSSYSDEMNTMLESKLAEFAMFIRRFDRSAQELQEIVRTDMMPQIYNLLSQFLGEPPTTFTWSYHEAGNTFESVRDRGAYHIVEGLTPLSFFYDFINDDFRIEDKILLRHDPRETSSYYRTYMGDYAGTIVGSRPDIAFNVPIEVMKAAAAKNIMDDQAVWFACDVSKDFNYEYALLSTEAFDYEGITSTSFPLTKAESIDMRYSAPTHAMSIVGVDMLNQDPVKWRVENSWGEWIGWGEDPGYLQMSDSWFDKYVYEVIVDAHSLPEDIYKLYKQEEFNPIKLPFNDPFGYVALQ
jgi:bleomycin hydrolase